MSLIEDQRDQTARLVCDWLVPFQLRSSQYIAVVCCGGTSFTTSNSIHFGFLMCIAWMIPNDWKRHGDI
jgi:hypothetical protein